MNEVIEFKKTSNVDIHTSKIDELHYALPIIL